MYFLIQIIYILNICVYNNNLENIRDFIREPFFVQKYLCRTKNNIDLEDGNIIILNLLEENATSIDWILLNEIINDNWMEFNIFGMKIGDGSTFVKKAIFLLAIGTAFFNWIIK